MIFRLLIFQFVLHFGSYYAFGDVKAVNSVTNSSQTFNAAESSFGTTIGDDGFTGLLVIAFPITACVSIETRPVINATQYGNITENTIALIKRGGDCDFVTKVFNAQQAKFDAVIVYNDKSDDILKMGSDRPLAGKIHIPSVFVGLSSGFWLQSNYRYNDNETKPYIIITKENDSFDLSYYLIPFCTVVGTCMFCIFVFMIVKFFTNRRRQRRSRLSQQRLKELPIKQFTKGFEKDTYSLAQCNACEQRNNEILCEQRTTNAFGDEYDVCAICLEEYEEGEKLRVLPCQHAYHCPCVDPWLTSNKRVCPLCKRRVLSDDESSNSEDESEDDTVNEEAPLLRNSAAASPNASRYATGFSRFNPFSRSYSTSTEEEEPVEPTSLRSTESPSLAVPTVVDETQNNEEDQTPVFYSLHDNTPNPLVVLADVSAASPEVPSSFCSAESIESYSCESSGTSPSNSSVADEDRSRVLILRSGTTNPVYDDSENATDA